MRPESVLVEHHESRPDESMPAQTQTIISLTPDQWEVCLIDKIRSVSHSCACRSLRVPWTPKRRSLEREKRDRPITYVKG